MKILESKLPGVLLVEPSVYDDHRGYFAEVWNARQYAQAGLNAEFVQDNISFSERGTLRGLHYQNPRPQGKFVYVLVGEVFDVAVDIRDGSSTIGQWIAARLSADNHRQLYMPPGFAHGFCVTSQSALVAYKCTEHYDPQAEGTILWDDPDLGIDWPVDNPVLSAKDRDAPRLKDVPCERLVFGETAEGEGLQREAV